MSYTFTYRRKLWKHKIKDCVGHQFNKELDRMDVFLENGAIVSLPRWSECTLYLGTDWVLFTKNQMEKESGQDIKLRAGIK